MARGRQPTGDYQILVRNLLEEGQSFWGDFAQDDFFASNGLPAGGKMLRFAVDSMHVWLGRALQPQNILDGLRVFREIDKWGTLFSKIIFGIIPRWLDRLEARAVQAERDAQKLISQERADDAKEKRHIRDILLKMTKLIQTILSEQSSLKKKVDDTAQDVRTATREIIIVRDLERKKKRATIYYPDLIDTFKEWKTEAEAKALGKKYTVPGEVLRYARKDVRRHIGTMREKKFLEMYGKWVEWGMPVAEIFEEKWHEMT